MGNINSDDIILFHDKTFIVMALRRGFPLSKVYYTSAIYSIYERL